MDSLTQIVLGAAVGEAVLGKKVGNKAILWGAIAGTVPDLDVLLRFFVDEISAMEMHRAFSHSILFSLIFSPIFGWLVSKIHKKDGVDWKGWSWLMFGAFFTHPLLDAHTNYGTQLLWPLDYKVAYKNIFIVDPLYTIPFLICVIWAMTLRRDNPKRTKINNIGLTISTSYLALTLLFKGIGYYNFTKSLEDQQIAYSEIETNPTPFNSILWTSTVMTEENYLVGYYSLLDGGDAVNYTSFEKNHHLLGDMVNEDIVQRLIKLSEGWYIIVKDGDKTYFNDMRFGQFLMTDDPMTFGFCFVLEYVDGELQAKQFQHNLDGLGDAIGAFFKRIVKK